MKKILLLSAVLVFGGFSASAADATPANLKLCYELFDAMRMEKQLSETSTQMLALQLQGNPMLMPFKAELEAFYKDCLQFNNLKEGIAKIYLELFTPDQIRDFIRFYRTPSGAAFAEKSSQLSTKVAAFSQQIVLKNMPSLQKAIQEKAAKLQQQKKQRKIRKRAFRNNFRRECD